MSDCLQILEEERRLGRPHNKFDLDVERSFVRLEPGTHDPCQKLQAVKGIVLGLMIVATAALVVALGYGCASAF